MKKAATGGAPRLLIEHMRVYYLSNRLYDCIALYNGEAKLDSSERGEKAE